MQTPLYFKNKGKLIAGTLYSPAGKGPFPAVAFFHGFTGNKSESGFIFTDMARRLASEGIVALTFDFRGSGESEGRFEDMTPLEEVSDARKALRVLAARESVDARRIGVLGLSLGGFVAAVAAGADKRVRSAVLWSAVARPLRVFRSIHGKKAFDAIESTGRLDVGGLCITRRFVEDAAATDPAASLAGSGAPALIIHGTGDQTVPFADSTIYLRARKGNSARTERLAVEGANHVFSRADWRKQVIDATAGWFRETLGP